MEPGIMTYFFDMFTGPLCQRKVHLHFGEKMRRVVYLYSGERSLSAGVLCMLKTREHRKVHLNPQKKLIHYTCYLH